ncbi:BatA domain-containing protein [Gemmatimonadota bacterium Y43]|uniref:BatA domain-containing protein n=1 Tax=Gaopeijia maritima TaxID=3119007 RepID=UPI00328EE1D1
MPLGFLVPLFLVGLIGLAVPIVVHLTRRQRAKVVRFPSLMFLEKVPYQAENRRRIHHWLLLALRALALALLVLAFARPFVRDDAAVAIAGTGPTEHVVVLDRSYSMAIEDRWADAVEAAGDAVGSLGPLDRVSLVVFDQGAAAPVRSTSDASRIRAALDTLAVTDRATRYGPALKLAQTILEESELPGKALTVVSDLQRGGWTGEEGVSVPEGTEIEMVAVGSDPPANLAVGEVALTRDRFQGAERVTPRARITRVGGDAELEVQVVLEVDTREIQRQTVTLPAAGAVPVVFQPFTLTERHTRGVVRVMSDGLPDSELRHDDARRFVVSPGRATGVLLLDAPSGGAQASLHLRQALEVARGDGFRVDRVTGGAPGADQLSTYQVVILNDRPFPEGSEGERLRDFVASGGGLLMVAGSRGGWTESAGGLLPGTLGAVQDREEGRGGRLGYLDYDHPVFELFRGPRRGDFSAARFFRARSWQVPPGDSVTVLARFDDGSPALAERRSGEGRVLVWASTLDAFWTDLALQPVFVPFVHQVVGYASGRTEVLDAFTAGQILDVSDARAMETAGLGEVAEALAAAEGQVALAPSGGTTELSAGAGPHFLELGEQGFYEIRPPGRNDVRPVAVAVNVDPAEADLAPLDPEEVEASIRSGAGGTAVAATDTERAAELRLEDRERRQSLWRWMLVGAFLLLAAETVLSNRVSRARRNERAGAPQGAQS